MTIAVLIPVLGRPRSAKRVIQSLTDSKADATPYFICSPGDTAQIRACKATGATTWTMPNAPNHGQWAAKINYGIRKTTEDWVLLGADDLGFHKNWDKQALRVHAATGALVIGTNDQGNPAVIAGRLATHALVHRTYITDHGVIDGQGTLVHEGYWHNCVDLELTETAKARKQFAFAKYSIVEHLHPAFHKAEIDATYVKGMDKDHFRQDLRLLGRRRKMWMAILRRAERERRIHERSPRPRRVR